MKRTTSNSKIRLNKFIADCGVASRRKADELIEEGLVKVNGKTAYELGVKVDPETDKVTVKGKPLRTTGTKVYYALHKPKGVLTTMSDPEGRPTVGDLFKRLKTRIFPVGRLDWDTEGLLLLTNDGDFSHEVMHPSKKVPKTYLAKVDGQPSEAQLQKLRDGVSIVGGRVKADRVERIKKGSAQYDWISLSITEGKNRQVRKMFEKIGYDVQKLKRVSIGRLKLGTLKKGEYRQLTPLELERIFKAFPESPEKTRTEKTKPAKPSSRRSTPTASRKPSRKAPSKSRPASKNRKR